VAQNNDAQWFGPASGWAPTFNAGTCSTWSSYTADVQDYATQFATYILWAATGRKYGLVSVQVRPLIRRAIRSYVTYPAVFDPWGGSGGTFAWGLMPVSGGTQLINFADDCIGSPPEIQLPGPVGAITDVSIDGVTVNPSVYRLDGDRLVRQDGNPWPVAQDLAKPLGQTNTWSVTYTRGETVPSVVNLAAGLYACQVAKARTGGTCVLPNKVTSITRQGVSVQTVNVSDYLHEGLTGVGDVDTLILAVNPFHARSRPRVVSPDLPRYR
jgi:hypothetical protein